MKSYIKISLVLLIASVLCIPSSACMAQKKEKARLSVEYVKKVNKGRFLKIEAKYKGEDGYKPIGMLPLNIYQEFENDSLVKLGEVTTKHSGKATFKINTPLLEDSIFKYTYVVKIENNDRFKDGDDDVKVFDANVKAEIITKDSINYVSAKLTDAKGEAMAEEDLVVLVQRLFAPLKLGQDEYETKKDGTILVPIEEPLPGKDGILTLEVMFDGRKYGKVSYEFDAPIGTPIVDQSDFDKRTMWSPPSKTPLFLLTFPNIIILGIWFIIFLLIRNLFVINKS